VASASLVTAVATLVQQGDELYQQQDYAKAREVYLSAMARIPAVKLGYGKLSEIEKLFSDKQKKQVGALLAAGNAAYRARNYDGAVEQYGKALETLQGERGTVDTLIAQLEEIGSLTRNPASDARLASLEDVQRKRAAMLAQISALRDRYVRISGQPAGTSRESLVTLLEAKLLVQKVLLSKEVIAQYPDLADRLNRYIEALVEERVSQARMDAISDLDTLLSGLIEKSGRTRGEPRLISLSTAEQKDTLLRILDKLQVLLQ
jgi:tetratricopeptide (TPR) repeat protein